MTSEYALTQLLKLDPLTFDEIKLYTGWTDEKTNSAIEKCKASGEIERKCFKSQFGYKWSVRTMRKVELARRTLECLQPEMPSLRGADMQEHAVNEYHQRSTGRENRGEFFGLGEIWR